MGQWSQGGMVMVGDMFNNALKARVDALATELAGTLRSSGLFVPAAHSSQSQSQGFADQGVSLFVPGSLASGAWWPPELGSPASVGAQNDLRYATFPSARRLAIARGSEVTVYDTADHRITGFSQQQSGDQSLSFTSQHGLVRLADLAVVGPAARPAPAAETPTPPAAAPSAPTPPPAQAAPSGDVFAAIERAGRAPPQGHHHRAGVPGEEDRAPGPAVAPSWPAANLTRLASNINRLPAYQLDTPASAPSGSRDPGWLATADPCRLPPWPTSSTPVPPTPRRRPAPARRARSPTGCGRAARGGRRPGPPARPRRPARADARRGQRSARSSSGARPGSARPPSPGFWPTPPISTFVQVSAIFTGVADLQEDLRGRAAAPLERPRHPALRRRDPPLQPRPAGRLPAADGGRHHRAGRRHHREPLLRAELGAALPRPGPGAEPPGRGGAGAARGARRGGARPRRCRSPPRRARR